MSEQSADPLLRQRELIVEIANSVVASVSGPWSSIRYEIRSLAPFQQDLIYVTRPDGSEDRAFANDHVIDLDDELRAVMYRPGAGTWFAATISVSDRGSVNADFNYDDEPAWTAPIEPAWYVQDLEKFPRDDAAIPAWLRAEVSKAI